jgi:hypothetical protein
MLATVDAAAAIGVSFRQLDYLSRTEGDHPLIPPSAGSGVHRRWDVAVVVRLALAHHIAQSVPGIGPGQSLFPAVAMGCLDPTLGAPPRWGYACVSPDCVVQWADSRAAILRAMTATGAVLVVPYDLDDLVGTHVNLDLDYGPRHR